MKPNKENVIYDNQGKITQNEQNVNKHLKKKKKNLNTLPKLANHTIKYEAEYYL